MVIFYKLVDLIEMVWIKVVTLNAKVSFDTFGKELRLISVSLGCFHIESQSWIIVLALWFEKVFDLRQDSVWLVSKLMSLQNFSQLACVSILRLSLISFCNWLISVFTKGSCAWEYCRLSLRFSLIIIDFRQMCKSDWSMRSGVFAFRISPLSDFSTDQL